jgi:glycosyltransferase involved in cell wall biosynthesis
MKAGAGKNIEFIGFVERAKLIRYMQKARAFILAAEEDFGITSLEAQSCCTPVIAYRKGGYLETVVDGKTGVFFEEQTVDGLKNAILKFEKQPVHFKKDDFLFNVSHFTVANFRKAFKTCVTDYVERKNK